MGISVRGEGAKQVILSDIKKGSLGRQTGKRAAQNLSPNLGTTVGQSPSRFREQTAWPIVGNALDDEREKRTGLGGEKTKGTENYCLVSLQRSGDNVGEEKEP